MKLAISSSKKLYKMLEILLLVFGDGRYRIFDRRFPVFCFKDLRLIGRCLWFITLKQSKQTKTRKPGCSKFWLIQFLMKVLYLNSFLHANYLLSPKFELLSQNIFNILVGWAEKRLLDNYECKQIKWMNSMHSSHCEIELFKLFKLLKLFCLIDPKRNLANPWLFLAAKSFKKFDFRPLATSDLHFW